MPYSIGEPLIRKPGSSSPPCWCCSDRIFLVQLAQASVTGPQSPLHSSSPSATQSSTDEGVNQLELDASEQMEEFLSNSEGAPGEVLRDKLDLAEAGSEWSGLSLECR